MNNDKIVNEEKKTNSVPNQIDIKKYEDPTGIGAKNLDLGLWLANHKKAFTRTIVVILSIVAGSLILYAAYNYFYYFSLGQEQHKVLEQTNLEFDIAAYRLQTAAKPLEIISYKSLNNRNGYDFIAKVKNPNSRHFANLNYCFVFNSEERCSSSYILPDEEKVIILFNQEISEAINNLSFKVNDINWQKLNASIISDWNIYKGERLSFSTQNVKTSTYDGGLNYLEFSLSNDSAYAYYSVPLNILIESNGDIIAVNRYTAQDVNSRDIKEVRLYWSDVSLLNGTIKIVPDLNIIDESIYKPYRSN